MALIYHTARVTLEDSSTTIRPLVEEDYHVAITFTGEDDEEITEILLTKDEVKEAYDVLFNR